MATRVGKINICPLSFTEVDCQPVHCFDDCEWNDGEGCAVWRIVKALEGLRNKLDLYGIAKSDSK